MKNLWYRIVKRLMYLQILSRMYCRGTTWEVELAVLRDELAALEAAEAPKA